MMGKEKTSNGKLNPKSIPTISCASPSNPSASSISSRRALRIVAERQASGRGGAAAGLRGEIHPHHRAAPALGKDELHALRRSRRTDRRREEGASVRARARAAGGRGSGRAGICKDACRALSSSRAAAQQAAACPGTDTVKLKLIPPSGGTRGEHHGYQQKRQSQHALRLL